MMTVQSTTEQQRHVVIYDLWFTNAECNKEEDFCFGIIIVLGSWLSVHLSKKWQAGSEVRWDEDGWRRLKWAVKVKSRDVEYLIVTIRYDHPNEHEHEHEHDDI